MDNNRYGQLLWTFNTGGLISHFDKVALFQEMVNTNKTQYLMPEQQDILNRLISRGVVTLKGDN